MAQTRERYLDKYRDEIIMLVRERRYTPVRIRKYLEDKYELDVPKSTLSVFMKTGSVIAAVAVHPVLLVTAPFAAYFAHSAMSERDRAILHATSAAVPDSAIQETIHQYERDNPPTVIYDAELEGRLAEEPALAR
jgi:hypothetical protein